MLCPAKTLHITGKIFVLYFGLCVLLVLLDMNRKGVYVSALVNCSWYWTQYIYGEKMKPRFANKGVGSMDVLCGELKMFLFVYLIWKRKTMLWWWWPTMRQMNGRAETNYGQLMVTQRLCTDITNTEILWNTTIQDINQLLNWRRHGIQASRKIIFFPFCWLCRKWILTWGSTISVHGGY